jgi:hypothetical protein
VRGVLVLTLAACSLTVAACGSDDGSEASAACLAGPDAYVEALRRAPDDVRLADGTPISDCLAEGQGAGELGSVGEAMITAATRLNSDALRTLDQDTAVELGYLVGAIERGAESTGGIHEDLLRRVEAAAGFTGQAEAPAGSFRDGFEEGLAAGREGG